MAILHDILSLHYFCLYYFMFLSTKLNSFAHKIANIIKVLLCLVRYSLFANNLHPAKTCSTIFVCWAHRLHLLHSASPLEPLYNFVRTICSSIVSTEAVFLDVRFCFSHTLLLSSCFRNILFFIYFSRYSSFRLCSTPFFNLAFIVAHVGFQYFSILSPSSKMQSSSKCVIIIIIIIITIIIEIIIIISFVLNPFCKSMH